MDPYAVELRNVVNQTQGQREQLRTKWSSPEHADIVTEQNSQ
jgi:hypothetical protein